MYAKLSVARFEKSFHNRNAPVKEGTVLIYYFISLTERLSLALLWLQGLWLALL